jgi:hypothetical protein
MSVIFHPAAMENCHERAVAQVVGYPYGLLSVYSYISKQFDEPPVAYALFDEKGWKTQLPFFKNVIMDSGIFTFFGRKDKEKYNAYFMNKWQDAIIEFVEQYNYTGTMVEVDCQDFVSTDHAWKLRRKLREALPNRQINVFHLADGSKGLDRLIEFSDYLAISVPRLKSRGFNNEKLYKLAFYIKNRKPSIDIHLLGCSSPVILKRLRFCTSADASSWTYPVRYGYINLVGKRIHVNNLPEEQVQRYGQQVQALVNQQTNAKGEYITRGGRLCFSLLLALNDINSHLYPRN